MKFLTKSVQGFTLVEILVVVAIIGMLSSVLYVNFNEARLQARDKARMTGLKELQLSLELYKAQYGEYPAQGCGGSSDFAGPGPASGGFASCNNYIVGLAPEFISVLPTDPKFEGESNRGFYYRSTGDSYKAMIYDSAEAQFITSYGQDFARCPGASGGSCPGTVPATTYAVYSAGAESW